jgi:arylformamidase
VTTWKDISVLVEPDLAPYPRNPAVAILPALRRANGDTSNVSEIRMGTHTGTHVDAPSHDTDGAATADQIALDILVGEAWVVDARGIAGHLDASALERLWPSDRVERLLVRTANSDHWDHPADPYPTDFVGLLPDAAALLVERGVRLVGTDGLSIEPYCTPGRPTHAVLVEAEVVVVEGLDLRGVEAGRYQLICLPLRLRGADGSPARAILGRL